MLSNLPTERLPAVVRLTLLLLAVTMGSIALTLALVGWALQRDLAMLSRSIAEDEVAEYAGIYNRHGLASVVELFDQGGRRAGHAMHIIAPGGQILFSYSPDSSGSKIMTPEEQMAHLSAQGGGEQIWTQRELADGARLIYGRDSRVEREFRADIFQQLWVSGWAVVGMAVLPIVWFSREISGPLREFTRQARRIAGGDGPARLDAPRGVPELIEFAAAFNEGLDRIERLTESLRLANDQLAHEIRTPLARLRVSLEHSSDAGGALEEIDRINSLLQKILDVRAGETGLLKLSCEVLEPAQIIADLAELYAAAATERGILLETRHEGVPRITADRQRILQALSNLLDNALRFSPSGEKVVIRTSTRATGVVLSVEDRGSGYGSPPAAPHQGMGLGLRLTSVIAAAHGGSFEIAKLAAGGTRAAIIIPAADGNTA
ncbi:MAG: hypothetical protein Fur0032_24000 [Terrimicrobiaceae bacterium]